jgi:hypothetical protein
MTSKPASSTWCSLRARPSGPWRVRVLVLLANLAIVVYLFKRKEPFDP